MFNWEKNSEGKYCNKCKKCCADCDMEKCDSMCLVMNEIYCDECSHKED